MRQRIEHTSRTESASRRSTLGATNEILHVGVVVKNVDETARKLGELLRIGPFEILEPEYSDVTVYGKPAQFRIRLGRAKAGPVVIALIQPVSGESVYEEFVRRKGHGLHHLAFRTDDLETTSKRMRAKGFKAIQSGSRPGLRFAYFDTEEQMDVTLEFVEFVKSE